MLAISGRLRAASLNTAMLRMAQSCVPHGVGLHVYEELGQLPLFNPDLEGNEPPAVHHLRAAIGRSDALLFASPEYAHGISGVLKNALDWMVSSGVFVSKPVALWNASPGLAALRQSLHAMSARLVYSADLELLIKPSGPTPSQVNPNPTAMRGALESLKLSYTSNLTHGLTQQ
ncbi:NADPH-dependent FMN reductase [Rhodoferax sp.]|uniref:NADPH-dependent FMN reductase n=1 Tax=Rhodoferax sp. TaxID=50421 RepID=UPI0025D9384D|nr:NADPH-dependent FMN reductase [Rhodoferax sp.]MCM2340019.1 NAD(P)H-dependent oxidoreductase [Rhodoferax sp.]